MEGAGAELPRWWCSWIVQRAGFVDRCSVIHRPAASQGLPALLPPPSCDQLQPLTAAIPLQVTRIHWEKNRFIYDLMYNRKVRGSRQRGGSGWQSFQAMQPAGAAAGRLLP